MTDPNLDLQESGWEELRKDARKIEGDLDVKLSSYAKLGARFTQGGFPLSFSCISLEFCSRLQLLFSTMCIAYILVD